MTQDSHDEKRRKHMAVMDDRTGQAMTEELKRYELTTKVSERGAFYGVMAEAKKGEYVRFVDAQAAIAAAMMGAADAIRQKYYVVNGDTAAEFILSMIPTDTTAADGSLHSSEQEAIIRSLQYLSTNACGQVLGHRVAMALFANRKQVIEILTNTEEQTT